MGVSIKFLQNENLNGMSRGLAQHRLLSTSQFALSKIIYTECDEAPLLATYSLLPVIQRYKGHKSPRLGNDSLEMDFIKIPCVAGAVLCTVL